MWSKAGESGAGKKNLMSTGMSQLETASDVERLKEENVSLRTTLEQVGIKDPPHNFPECQHWGRDGDEERESKIGKTD